MRQTDIRVFKKCKAAGIHTCLDTSGVGDGDYEEILAYTDLVLYDVKAIDPDGYRRICGGNIEVTEKFQKALAKSGVETVVRQVVVPGINDSDEYMLGLKKYINEKIPQKQRDQILLVTEGNQVLWIPGYRKSAGYSVTEHTKTILEISVNEGESYGREN